jgi:hypothetical protein
MAVFADNRATVTLRLFLAICMRRPIIAKATDSFVRFESSVIPVLASPSFDGEYEVWRFATT